MSVPIRNQIIINNKYRLLRKIGSGSFGDIYLGLNINHGGEVAIKIEAVDAKHPQLHYESRIYRVLITDFTLYYFLLGSTIVKSFHKSSFHPFRSRQREISLKWAKLVSRMSDIMVRSTNIMCSLWIYLALHSKIFLIFVIGSLHLKQFLCLLVS